MHDGALNSELRAAVTRHLDECHECRTYAGQYASVIRLTKLVATAEDEGDVPEEVVQAILGAVRAAIRRPT